MEDAEGHTDPEEDAGAGDAADEPVEPDEVAECPVDVAAVGWVDGAAA
jgi:hypothetical protein